MTPRAQGLSSRDRGRVEEVQRLASSGSAGVAGLVALLTEPSWAVRRVVVASLARIGAPAVAALCDVLRSDRVHEARLAAAVDALVDSTTEVAPALLELAERCDNPAVVCDVAQILGRRKNRRALPVLAQWATDPDDNVAVAALEALGRIGGLHTIEPLLDALRTRNLFRTFPAIKLLGQSGDPRVVAPLVELLAEPHYAAEAAGALGATGQLRALAPLARLLVDTDDRTVRGAARALTELRARNMDRFGDPAVFRAAFSAEAGGHAVRRLTEALDGADVDDKIALATLLGWLHDERGIATLIGLLDSDAPTAQLASEALRPFGPEAEPAVRAALRTGDSALRLLLLPLLGVRRSVVGELLPCLDDADPSVRVLACNALGRIGEPAVVARLYGLVSDDDPRVVQAASAAVQSLGSEEAKARALEGAQSAHPATRRASLRIVAYFGYPEGLDLLVRAMSDGDERIREAAASGLALYDDVRATSVLLAAARGGSAGTRAAVMRALGHTASTPEIATALRDGLDDPEPWVRYYACQSIGKLRATSAADRVDALLADPEGQVRVAAVEAIARLGGERALAALAGPSVSSDADVRRAALAGLGRLHRPAAFALVLRGVESEDPATRLAAVAAIGEAPGEAAVRALIRASVDPDPGVRSLAFGLLATRPDPHATRWLIDRLAVDSSREDAISALAHEVDGRIEGILGALETADATISSALIEALMGMRRPSARAAAEAALQLGNVCARRAAATALVGIGSAALRDLLTHAAAVDPDPVVRQICAMGA